LFSLGLTLLVHLYDIFIFALALSIPAAIVFLIRSAWLSLPFAALAAWLIIYAGGVLLTLTHSKGHSAAVDAAWLRTGWGAGLIYACLLFLIRIALLYARRTRKT